ncbi:hypothetical protein C1I97_31075 [Streptomyces sp. NTH33]|nr:hypothetical protein C1I97_31075 [Streptomyces sp. NTH33]
MRRGRRAARTACSGRAGARRQPESPSRAQRVHRLWTTFRSRSGSGPKRGEAAWDLFGSYDVVRYASGALYAAAALMALVIRRRPRARAGGG